MASVANLFENADTELEDLGIRKGRRGRAVTNSLFAPRVPR
jgi:hypothetical protein